MRSAGLWLAVAGLVASVPGFAADAQVEGGRQCAQLKDSLQRLVCYDRIFQAGDASVPAPSAAPRTAAPPPAPVPAPAPRIVAAAPAVAAAPVAAPALGDESVQRKEKEKNKPAEPTSLEATITALKETRPQVVRLTLDNGQVWQQMDMSTVFQVSVGDSIRIEKGAMGGYRAARTSGSRSSWVRVTRVQ
jgi:hypothetical protein